MNILIYNILQAQLPTGIVILLGAKLPEVFKDSDADFNLGIAIGYGKAVKALATGPIVKIAFNGQFFDPDTVGRHENGDFYYTV